ncbi:MAG: bifunctional class I SAM-dependent methyltransferase/glycosyltransferase family 2 protein [Candidatus Gorgyraea atricola]|nr:bifunctional class I SAM-dependent methyltransferase/glycosyltransferase family 2 protein [Candidatus Gorgyraea atricola]
MMRHLFHILPGQSILEIGGGNGKFTQVLAQATRGECKITSIVFSREYLDNKKNLACSNVDTLYMDMFPGSLVDRKFDCVVAQDMLEKNTATDFLYIVKSLIKPGGSLLLFEPNSWNPYYRIRRTIRKILPVDWKRPSEGVLLNRLQVFSVLSEIGYAKINVLPYDFLYSPIPKFLVWPAKNMSIIMENCPYLRNLAGSLYIWAQNPAFENHKELTVDLCEHPMFFKKVSFIIPCHNEEMNIKSLVKNLKDFYDRYIFEIIIVDDNSKDRTAEITEALVKEDSRIRLIKRVPPNGVGRALRDGLKKAKGEYILIMDSDFQHIIPEMRDLFDVVAKGADVAVGSRFSRDSVLVKYDFTKIIANRFFHILANLFLGRHFRDISNNLKIFRREVIEKITIESDDFAANAETGLKPLLLGYNVKEVPISWINRSVDMGVSSFKVFKTGPNYFKILLKLVWRRIIGKL